MDRDAVAVVLVALAVAGGGAFLVYDHYRTVADSRPVDGVVVESAWGSDPEGGASLHLEYRYTVDGERYTATNVCPGVGDAGCYGHPSDVAERYPEGASVTVYVDPDDPSRSFLLKDEPPTAGAFFAVAGFGFALLVAYGAVRSG